MQFERRRWVGLVLSAGVRPGFSGLQLSAFMDGETRLCSYVILIEWTRCGPGGLVPLDGSAVDFEFGESHHGLDCDRGALDGGKVFGGFLADGHGFDFFNPFHIV